MYKINELAKIAKLKGQALFGDLSVYVFMQDYDIDYPTIDRYFNKRFGSFSVIGDYPTAEEALTEFREDVNALLHTTEANYNRIYQLTKLVYNPIDNYDRTEERTVEKQGNETTTNVYDAVTNSGTVTTKEHTDTLKNGAVNETVENTVATYDSDNYKAKDKTATNSGEVTNTNIYGAVENETSSTTSGRTDSSDLAFTNRKDIENVRIHGNIGVTTSAQMISGEKELWSNFVFYNMIFNDILQNLCIYVEE